MNKDWSLGFLMGIGTGAALGMLYAPKAGSELRRDLANRVDQSAQTVKEQAACALDKGRAELALQQEGLTNAVEAGKKAYQESAGVASIT
jgi:gas vesicle protein